LGYAATLDDGSAGAAADAVGVRRALLDSLAESAALSAGTRWTVVAAGLFALMWSARSAARAIRAAHVLAWEGGVGRFSRPLAAGAVLLLALAGFLAVWGVAGWARANLGVAGLAVAILAIVPFFAIWLGVSILLPHAGAPWTALAPGALLVAVGMQLVHLGTVLFLADRVERASATYGSFGAALTILVWLYVVSRVIVASAMLDASLWERHQRAPVLAAPPL
jgi:membrane protein